MLNQLVGRIDRITRFSKHSNSKLYRKLFENGSIGSTAASPHHPINQFARRVLASQNLDSLVFLPCKLGIASRIVSFSSLVA